MISELKDEEILDFLMNSDFDGDYSPDELKYLLTKWRFFYRIIYGVLERTKTDHNGVVNKLESDIEILKDRLNKSEIEGATRQNKIDSFKNRKLTFRERFFGKIIINENEDI